MNIKEKMNKEELNKVLAELTRYVAQLDEKDQEARSSKFSSRAAQSISKSKLFSLNDILHKPNFVIRFITKLTLFCMLTMTKVFTWINLKLIKMNKLDPNPHVTEAKLLAKSFNFRVYPVDGDYYDHPAIKKMFEDIKERTRKLKEYDSVGMIKKVHTRAQPSRTPEMDEFINEVTDDETIMADRALEITADQIANFAKNIKYAGEVADQLEVTETDIEAFKEIFNQAKTDKDFKISSHPGVTKSKDEDNKKD